MTSSDGRHVAYVAQEGDKQFVVVDGKEGKHYDGIGSILFSALTVSMWLYGQAGKKRLVVVDGKEGKQYDILGLILFSALTASIWYMRLRLEISSL